MTANETANENESERIAGQCDICAKPIDLSKHTAASIGVDREGEYEISPEEAIEAIASSLEISSTPEDRNLAEALREKGSYTVHEACLEKTGLADEAVWTEGGS